MAIRRVYGPQLVLSLAVMVSASACKPKSDQAAPSGGSGGSAAATVLIGGTLPLTGGESRVGKLFQEGYDLALDEVKQQGGLDVGGKKVAVELKILDDTSSAATAATLADRLINSDHVSFFLGTYSTALVEAQSTVAEQNKVPYVNGGGAASEIYKRGYKYVFGTLSPVELLGGTLMSWIDEQQKAGKLPKPSKIALLGENTAHGQDFRKGVSDFVGKSGGGYEIVLDEAFDLGGKDFSALLSKVKATGADIFLADAHLPDYITMQRQYMEAGMCHKVVSYGARGSEHAAVEALGKDNVNYILSGVWWSAPLADTIPAAKKFVEAFKAKYAGRTPEWFQALGYETARALFVAIQQAGSLDREAVRGKLATLKIESLLPGGTLEFTADKGGEVQNLYVVQQNLPDANAPIIYPKDVAKAAGVAPNPRCPQ